MQANNVRLLREKNDGRLKGFGYAEFESVTNLVEALSLKGTVRYRYTCTCTMYCTRKRRKSYYQHC